MSTTLDNARIFWLLKGNSLWHAQTNTTHDGNSALQSGGLTEMGGSSRVEGLVEGPGELSFWWKLAPNTNLVEYRFWVPGTAEDLTITEDQDWQQVRCRIPAGSQRLCWDYTKYRPAGPGGDAGYLDQVVFTPDGAPRIIGSSKRPDGSFQLQFTGTPGADHRVWVSTNLKDWSEVGAATETDLGLFAFDHATPPSGPTGFYRIERR